MSRLPNDGPLVSLATPGRAHSLGRRVVSPPGGGLWLGAPDRFQPPENLAQSRASRARADTVTRVRPARRRKGTCPSCKGGQYELGTGAVRCARCVDALGLDYAHALEAGPLTTAGYAGAIEDTGSGNPPCDRD